MNRPTTRKKLKQLSKNLSTNKSSVPDDLPGKFHQIFKEELILILLKLLQKDMEGKLPN